MTVNHNRPTPDGIAWDIVILAGRHDGLERDERIMDAATKAIRAERAEADRRVAEERAAVVRWLREDAQGYKETGDPHSGIVIDAEADDIERGEHHQDSTPPREVDVPGCMCVPYQLSVCEACEKHFDLDRGEHRK